MPPPPPPPPPPRRWAPRPPPPSPLAHLPARPLDGVHRALARHVDRPTERVARLVARPQRVELVGDVREHDALGAGVAAVLARLARREVPALAGALGPRQRGLYQ